MEPKTPKLIIVWKVRVPGTGTCMFEHLSEAWYDWKTHDGLRWIYPKLIRRDRWEQLPEHGGW